MIPVEPGEYTIPFGPEHLRLALACAKPSEPRGGGAMSKVHLVGRMAEAGDGYIHRRLPLAVEVARPGLLLAFESTPKITEIRKVDTLDLRVTIDRPLDPDKIDDAILKEPLGRFEAEGPPAIAGDVYSGRFYPSFDTAFAGWTDEALRFGLDLRLFERLRQVLDAELGIVTLSIGRDLAEPFDPTQPLRVDLEVWTDEGERTNRLAPGFGVIMPRRVDEVEFVAGEALQRREDGDEDPNPT